MFAGGWSRNLHYCPYYMYALYKIRGFPPTNLAITSYTHKPWHRRYFLNREPPYWLQSSITGCAFRGFILVLQKNSMLKDTKMFRSRMAAFMCIHTCYPSRLRNRIGWRPFRCLLRSDWVIAQLVRKNLLENRTGCNSFSPDVHVFGTFERHVTLYDWSMYRAIGRLRTDESYRVAAPLGLILNHPVGCS